MSFDSLRGKAWKYGDDVDTDVIIPARYLNTSNPAELASHCMEDIHASFASRVAPGDFIVAQIAECVYCPPFSRTPGT